MSTIVFVIPGTARGKQRPRFARTGRVYTPPQTVNQEAYIKMLAATAMRGLSPLIGPLEATFSISVAIPKSFTGEKRKRIEEGKLFPTSKPDLDNVVKLLCDAMNGVVYGDDMQIVDLYVNKTYAAAGSTTVMVSMKGTNDGHDRSKDGGELDG